MKISSALLFLFLSVTFSAFSQNNDAENVDKEARDPDPSSAAIQVATNLVRLGVTEKNPLYLVSAAEILIKNPTNTFAMEENEGDGNEEVSQTKDGDSDLSLDPKQILAKAKNLAKDNATVLALVDKAEAKLPKKEQVVERGAKYGRVYTSRKVNANRTYTFYLTYRGGYSARLSIIGDGDTDLDFYIYDNYGNLVGSDTDYSDEAYFYWTPRRDTEYKVRVVNRGSVYNKFTVVTN